MREVELALVDEVESQLARFCREPAHEELSQCPLAWWQDNAWKYPHLSLVAMHYLGIPGSTASLERLFSAAGLAVTRRRPRLTATRACGLIFGHANVVRGYRGTAPRKARLQSTQAQAEEE